MDKPRKNPKRRLKKCPTPNKKRYSLPYHAKTALVEIEAKGKPEHRESRVYRCLNHYHLTSQPLDES